MTASITINNQQLIPQSISNKPKSNDNKFNAEFSNQITRQRPKSSSVEQVMFADQITHIKRADLETIYNEIKWAVKSELDAADSEENELKPFDYLEGNIDKIMYHPIEVKIERDEVYTAIIYNRMGINYLDLKRIETRIGLLELAKEDVDANEHKGSIRKDQTQHLNKQITSNRDTLENEKQALLDNKQLKENEQRLFEQLTRGLSYTKKG
jgi:hypothetical protein